MSDNTYPKNVIEETIKSCAAEMHPAEAQYLAGEILAALALRGMLVKAKEAA